VDFQIRITEAALADLEDILAYSWAKFPAIAERFGNAILNHVDLLKIFPYIGSPVAGRPGVRQLVHTPPDLLSGQ
jgi:plasmid stabilization system protein ParE